MTNVTYSDLMQAAGILTRAAQYLALNPHATMDDFQAAGTLTGLAYQVRPQKITLSASVS